MKRFILFNGLIFICSILGCYAEPVIKVLILSGNNNHDWQTTTPFLQRVLEKSACFTCDITERPDTIQAMDLSVYNVIVSDWNSFPEQKEQWNTLTKEAFLDFMEKGGGFVTIHAASATHYDWPPFLHITGGRWGEKTHHGPISDFNVYIQDPDHPITKGMYGFSITDELWIDLEVAPNAEILCVATGKDKNRSEQQEPVALITRYGKGRGFYLVLGHDTTTMESPDWQTLFLRGTEWAAKGDVTLFL